MSEPTARLVVDDWDLAELQRSLGRDFVTVDRSKPEGAAGEPVTILVLTLGGAAIAGLTGWLLKNRKRKTIEISGERIEPNGAMNRVKLKIDVRESLTDAEVVKQLGGLFPSAAVDTMLATLNQPQ